MATDVEIAWAAGLFEGEGCIGIWHYPSSHLAHPQIRLSLQMTDRDVVERFCQIVGCGKVGPEQRRRPPRKTCHVWTIGNREDAERIIRMLYPWLGERRRSKADSALAEIEKRKADLRRACEACGVEFVARTRGPARNYCSAACRSRDYYQRYGNVRVAERASA